MRILIFVLCLGLLICAGCKKEIESQPSTEGVMNLEVRSSVFEEGGRIPDRYTGIGADVSPPLSFSGVPEATQSLALICDDPDAPAGTWVHWVLFNLSPATRELTEAVDTEKKVLGGAKQGHNDFRKIGYGGPMPPPGKPHRYFFKVYALDTKLDIKAGITKAGLLEAMEGHILAEGQLMGTYSR